MAAQVMADPLQIGAEPFAAWRRRGADVKYFQSVFGGLQIYHLRSARDPVGFAQGCFFFSGGVAIGALPHFC